jgi:endo-1,4-beta-D-glucanase Y
MKRLHKYLIFIGILLIFLAAGILTAVAYFNSEQRSIPIVFSDNAMLLETWNNYKKNNLEPGSLRTLDKSQGNLTTSEGQSYTMLRAVWMDDQDTFDKSWKFAQDALQRPDSLFSWKYGQIGNGKYGIQTNSGGQNTASDADLDIALSLLMAYSRWNQPKYLNDAKPIITSIWQNEVVLAGGRPVLAADDLERNSPQSIVVNPSYFGFVNFKVFAKIDPTHDWDGLASSSYDLLQQLSTNNLDKGKTAGLPPNWITIDRATGKFIPAAAPNLDTNYGYDALRIPFRLALDYSWFKDPRDKEVLVNFKFLKEFWQQTHVLNAEYAHDGNVVGGYESPAMYGGAIGYFNLFDPAQAKEMYKTKLQTLYSPDQQAWKAPAPSYYEDNWAWFGIALTQNSLPNLTGVK